MLLGVQGSLTGAAEGKVMRGEGGLREEFLVWSQNILLPTGSNMASQVILVQRVLDFMPWKWGCSHGASAQCGNAERGPHQASSFKKIADQLLPTCKPFVMLERPLFKAQLCNAALQSC